MWAYMPPSISLPSAPAAAASISASPWRFLALERYFTWKGKRTRLKSLRAAWKRATFIRHLSGQMSPPLTAHLGAASFIASLRDSLASLTASLANAEASPTSGGFGPTSSSAFARLNPQGVFLKTSAASSALGVVASLVPYSQTWPASGSMRSGACFARLIPASRRRTSARASSSTPSVAGWATPMAYNHGPDSNRPGITALDTQARSRDWATPTAREGASGVGHAPTAEGSPNLRSQVVAWATPATRDWRDGRNSLLLGAQKTNARPLNEQAVSVWRWPTPTVWEQREDPTTWRMRQARLVLRGANGNGAGAALDIVAREFVDSRLVPQTTPLGGVSSPSALILPPPLKLRRVLNPSFVEWLMGWPLGWSRVCACMIAPTACVCSETVSSPPRLPSPSMSYAPVFTPDVQRRVKLLRGLS